MEHTPSDGRKPVSQACPRELGRLRLLADMRTWPRDSPRIFAHFASHASISKDMVAAGIEGRGRFHRFRSGAATYLTKCGLDLPTVAKLTRHADLNTLRKSYVEIELTQLVAAQSLMAG